VVDGPLTAGAPLLDSARRLKRALSAAQLTKPCNVELAYVARLADALNRAFSMLSEHRDGNQTHMDDTIVQQIRRHA
jgi:hypothetical protein